MFHHSVKLGGATLLASTSLPLLSASSPSLSENFSSLPLQSLTTERLLDVTPSSDQTDEFLSLQYALYVTSFVEVLGGVFFLLTSLYIVDDRERAHREIHGK